MTYKLTTLLFTIFFVNVLFSQSVKQNDTISRTVTINTKYGDLVIRRMNSASFIQAYFDLGEYLDRIYKEAQEKGMSKDVVYIKFINDSNCRVVDIQILKTGKIDSYAECVQSWCAELKKKLEEINNSGFFGEDIYGFCEEYRFPLRLWLK